MSPRCTEIAITRSILKLQDSSFACKPDFWELGCWSIFKINNSSSGFFLIFISFKNHVQQHRVPDQFFNYLNFYTPPPGGGRVEKFEFKLCPKFSFLIFRKSQEVSFHYVHPFKSIRRSKKTGALSAPPPNRIGLKFGQN